MFELSNGAKGENTRFSYQLTWMWDTRWEKGVLDFKAVRSINRKGGAAFLISVCDSVNISVIS